MRDKRTRTQQTGSASRGSLRSLKHLLALAFLPMLVACGSARPAPAGGRVLLGRLVIDGAPAGDWVSGGAFTGAELVVDDHVKIVDDRAAIEATSTTAVDPAFTTIGARGGPLRFGAGNGAEYVLGLRVTRSIAALGTTSVFPVLVAVPPRASDCDYIGTIHLEHEGETSRATVVDDYTSDAAVLARGVSGCTPARNLAYAFQVDKGAVVPVSGEHR
jgi:hypothetical protein